jgi:poly-gamma-glutamate capsule biosynthesis protein CapA/YwtB (metallophosphatase superfamily)
MPPTIGILGDVMLGRGVAEVLSEGSPERLWSPELSELARSCDLVVCNLECCISEGGRPTQLVPAKPFFFRAPPVAVESLRAIGVAAVGIANNHALDFGEEALADTVAFLRRAGIEHAGAGQGLQEARSGAVMTVGTARVGLVAVSDHPSQFAARPGHCGISHADLHRGPPPWLVEELVRLRAECDLVVAFPHWGPNMTTAPAYWQRACAGSLLSSGADIVAGHSAHVFHGVEARPTGPVLYDLGGAVDDYAVDGDLRNDLGLLALWRPWGAPELELVGLRLDFCHTTLAEGPDAHWIQARLERACGELGTRVERTAPGRFAVRPGAPG